MSRNSGGRHDCFDNMEGYNVESMAIHRKLQSKIEALEIMKKELERSRTERDQFKLMAETLQMKMKIRSGLVGTSLDDMVDYSGGSAVRALLAETRQRNIELQTKVDTLSQRLRELDGDICVLRNRSVDAVEVKIPEKSWSDEKSNFIAQLEVLKKQNAQLKYDIKSVLDEKEEVVLERDSYKCKAHRLNYELNVALKNDGPESKLLDLDALVLENKVLQEKLNSLEQEVLCLRESETDLKTQLECKRTKGIMKLTNTSTNNISPSVQNLLRQLENGKEMRPEVVHQVKTTCLNLLDILSDRSLALAHQKKANKLLATKIADLEHRLGGNAGEKPVISPSVLLLSGYAASRVDDESLQFHRYDDDPITLSPAASSSVIRGISSESNRSDQQSENSSEYELVTEMIKTNKVRSEFEDLPADLAEMIQKCISTESE